MGMKVFPRKPTKGGNMVELFEIHFKEGIWCVIKILTGRGTYKFEVRNNNRIKLADTFKEAKNLIKAWK